MAGKTTDEPLIHVMAMPWPSDMIQALAYTLLLAEHSGEEIKETRIRYHADNKLIEIPVDMGAENI